MPNIYFHNVAKARAIVGRFCIIALIIQAFFSAAQAQEARPGDSFAQCTDILDVLNSTLPAKINIATGEDGGPSKPTVHQGRNPHPIGEQKDPISKGLAKVQRTYADATRNPALTEHYHDELQHLREAVWATHQLSGDFWMREYRPFDPATSPDQPRIDPEIVARNRKVVALAGRVLAAVAKPQEKPECEPLRLALQQAALWAVANVARRNQAAQSDAMPLQDAPVAFMAMSLLKAWPVECASASMNQCLLAVRNAIILAEAPELTEAERSERREAALDRAEQVVERLSAMGPSLELAEAWMLLAELKAEAGSGVLADGPVREALAALDMAVPSASDVELAAILPNPFKYRRLPIYQHGVDSLYRRLNVAKAGPDAVSTELIAFGEKMRRAQIENVLGDACEPLDAPLRPKALRPNERLVYPVLGTQNLYLLVGRTPSADNPTGWTLVAQRSADRPGIERNADRLVTFLQMATDLLVARLAKRGVYWGEEDARQLHAALIAPLAAELGIVGEPLPASASDAAITTVIFLPDPALRNIPWALLHDGRHADPGYLVKYVAITVAPALAYVNVPTRGGRRGGILAGGLDERVGSEAKQGPFQPFVERLEEIYLPSRTLPPLIEKQFTQKELLDRLRVSTYPVLLLATHAQFDGARSQFVVNPSRSGKDDTLVDVDKLERTLRDNRQRAARIELLIFLSCQGATGDAGELGLAGLALRGGARTTIGAVIEVSASHAPMLFASSYRADDGAVVPDPEAFLPRYFAKHSPAHALRLAQLSRLKDHPAHWGSFLVVGSWR